MAPTEHERTYMAWEHDALIRTQHTKKRAFFCEWMTTCARVCVCFYSFSLSDRCAGSQSQQRHPAFFHFFFHRGRVREECVTHPRSVVTRDRDPLLPLPLLRLLLCRNTPLQSLLGEDKSRNPLQRREQNEEDSVDVHVSLGTPL